MKNIKKISVLAFILSALVSLFCACQTTPTTTEYIKITFELDGGSMEKTSVTMEKGAELDFSQYIPEKGNYEFKGWKNGEKIYKATDKLTVEKDMSFTAQWEKNLTDLSNLVFEINKSQDGYILKQLAQDIDAADIVIPGEYEGRPIVEIADNVFGYNDKIKSIDLTQCKALKKIGSWNFRSCNELVTVDLSGLENLTEIGDSCFVADSKLENIILSGLTGLEKLGSSCFRGDYGVGGKIMPLPVKELNFGDCSSLREIGQMSFWYLSNITELNFVNTSLTLIERQNIRFCDNLKSVSLPFTLAAEGIESEFLSDLDNLEEIIVHEDSLYLKVEQGILTDTDDTVIIKCPVKNDITEYIAPSGVSRICAQAFCGVEAIEVLDFSACRLTDISYKAFYGCANAKVIVPFDEDSFYLDGGKVTLGNDWNGGVKQTIYGEKYLYFSFTIIGITDGETVATDTITISASATYGENSCEITVSANGKPVSENGNSFSIALQEGENVIEIKASFGDKSETKTYKINKAGKAELKASISDGTVSGVMTFDVWVEVDGVRQDLSGKTMQVLFAWESSNYGSFNPVFGNDVSVIYNANEKCFNVSVDIDSINMMYFEDAFKIKLQIDGYSAEPLILSFVYEW